MNKKTITQSVLFLVMLLVTIGSYAENEAPIFKWADQVSVSGTKATSIANDIQTNQDKDVFILAKFGTVTDHNDTKRFCDHTTFRGRDFYGAKYGLSGGQSSNGNLIVSKTDVEGNLKWAIHTDAGDIYTAASVMIPTADGGCFLALKARNTDKNAYNDSLLIRVVSNDNSKQEIKWVSNYSADDFHSIYQPVFVKIDNNGIVTQLKKADVDYSAMTNASYYSYGTPDGFYFYGGGQDSEGNLYIGGNLRKKMTFEGNQEILPHNTANWDGDSQKRAGSTFILKLDENCNYLQHFTSGASDNITFDNVKLMKVEDDGIYVAGNVMGNNTNTFHIGSIEMTPNEYQSAYAAKLNKDLDVQWAKYYPFVKTQKRKDWKLYGLTVTDKSLYFVGGITGGIAKAETPTTAIAETGSNWLNGFLVKSSKDNGEILGAAVEQGSWIGLSFEALNSQDSIYMYGYDWGNGDTYDKWKIYLRAFSKNDLTAGKRYSLIKQDGMCNTWGAIAVDNTIITLSRYKKDQIEFLNSSTTFTSKGYTAVVAAWEFPGRNFKNNVITDNKSILEDSSSDIYVFTRNQNIMIKNTPMGESINVYNITGQRIASKISRSKNELITISNLPTGIYVVRSAQISRKVIVK